MRVGVFEVPNQKAALRELAKLVEQGTVDPSVRNAAQAIVHDCGAREDECEIQAIFDAIKTGTDKVEGLEQGVKYMSDPRWADFFTTPARMLKQCAAGVTGGDCDDQAALTAALLGSLGFVVGLRVWGEKKGEFTHVYAVVGLPKIGPTQWLGLDTTVEESEVGWEPPGGHVLTAILDGR